MEMQPPLPELIVRDISGERLSVAERARISAWVNDNAAHARMLARLRDAQWRMQEWHHYKDVDKQATWALMQARVENSGDQPPLPDLQHTDWSTTPKNRPTPGAVFLSAFRSCFAFFRY